MTLKIKHLVLPVFLMVFQTANAQLDFSSTNNGRVMLFTDQNGVSLLKSRYSPDIEGNPFVSPVWNPAELLLSSGKLLKWARVKLNLESNEIYFLDTLDMALVAKPGLVKKLNFPQLVSPEGTAYIFKCGYPVIDKQTENYYYQVLEEGKIELLKKLSKEIKTTKYDMSGEIKKEFVENSHYYLFTAGEIKEIKQDKAVMMEIMKDKNTEMEQFLSINKINFRKIADLRKLIRYYNDLTK